MFDTLNLFIVLVSCVTVLVSLVGVSETFRGGE